MKVPTLKSTLLATPKSPLLATFPAVHCYSELFHPTTDLTYCGLPICCWTFAYFTKNPGTLWSNGHKEGRSHTFFWSQMFNILFNSLDVGFEFRFTRQGLQLILSGQIALFPVYTNSRHSLSANICIEPLGKFCDGRNTIKRRCICVLAWDGIAMEWIWEGLV